MAANKSKTSQGRGNEEGSKSTLAKLTYLAINEAGPLAKKTIEEGSLLRRPKELYAQYSSRRADAFHYPPLPHSTSIRLLNIEPGNASGMIRCSLEKQPVLYRTVFEDAMRSVLRQSYEASGSIQENQTREVPQEATRAIWCNGQVKAVHLNLYDALLQLRQTAPGAYWVDALCINQDDDQEKMNQIRMMSQIYSSAQSVTVWLGYCPQPLSAGVAQLEISRDNLPKLPEKDRIGWFQLPLGGASMGSTFVAAAYILQRRWFRRLGVLQEFCLAKQVTILLGSHRISPATLTAAVNWIGKGAHEESNRERIHLVAKEAGGFWGLHIKLVPSLLEAREHFKQGRQWSLDEWLRLSKGRKASDARDFVYAGLGLIKPESLKIDPDIRLPPPATDELTPQSIPALWPALRPMSDIESSEVLFNLAACLLSQPRGVSKLLSFAYRLRDYEKAGDHEYLDTELDTKLGHLPSWVPNPASFASRVLEPLASVTGCEFAACTKLANSPQISHDGSILFLEAAKLGTISHCSPMPYGLPDNSNTLLPFLELAVNIPPQTCGFTTGGDRDQELDALANLLVLGPWPEGRAAEALVHWLHRHVGKCCEELRKGGGKKKVQGMLEKGACRLLQVDAPESDTVRAARLTDAYAALRNRYPHHPRPRREEEEGAETREISDLLQRYQRAVISATAWRAPFLITKGQEEEGGRYLGLGPSWTKVGDAVLLVSGAHVPYVFARVDDQIRRRTRAAEKALEDALKTNQLLVGKETKGQLVADINRLRGTDALELNSTENATDRQRERRT
ncbi:heterokaryon incompatibility protein-domain-containing protein [Xylariomycetidae sp. FL2044]|nr:heterokaryon incompatibility protein-domain-containing protein [Xylariomycetidae sp. FL2044]